MEICTTCPSIAEEDLRAARAELKTYVDITDEDLMKIYILAARNARRRRSTLVPVRSVMTGTVVSVTPGTSMNEAAFLLAKHKITGMPVVDKDSRVVGVVSEADVRSRRKRLKSRFRTGLRWLLAMPDAVRRGGDRVEDIMTAPPITIEPDADVKEVAAILDMHRIKRLPVVDRDGKIQGIISRGDIIRAMAQR